MNPMYQFTQFESCEFEHFFLSKIRCDHFLEANEKMNAQQIQNGRHNCEIQHATCEFSQFELRIANIAEGIVQIFQLDAESRQFSSVYFIKFYLHFIHSIE